MFWKMGSVRRERVTGRMIWDLNPVFLKILISFISTVSVEIYGIADPGIIKK